MLTKFILLFRRKLPAARFHKEALERHTLNLKGAAMWHELEDKYRKGVE